VSDAGDLNGDGFADVIFSNGFQTTFDSSRVLFGGSDVSSSETLPSSSLFDGTTALVINEPDLFVSGGLDEYQRYEVTTAGDINGDGVSDLLIADSNNTLYGYDGETGNPFETRYAGQSYVIFGGVGVGDSGPLDLGSLDGSNGFVIDGINSNDRLGTGISEAGDVNNDGVPDFIITAAGSNVNANGGVVTETGESYVIFGGENIGSSGTLDLTSLDGTNGFVINGIASFDSRIFISGNSVSGGEDINGDGVPDLIVGDPFADGCWRSVG